MNCAICQHQLSYSRYVRCGTCAQMACSEKCLMEHVRKSIMCKFEDLPFVPYRVTVPPPLSPDWLLFALGVVGFVCILLLGDKW